MDFIYHPLAEVEVIQTAEYYQSKVHGLGAEFLDELDKTIEIIGKDPQRWPVRAGNIRRYLLKRFPYIVFYEHTLDTIYIYSVVHHHRHPDYWKDRVKS